MICQSVVVKVASHVCKSGLSVPVVGFMCADPALLPTSSLYFIVTGADYGFLPPSFFMDVVPNCGKGPLSSGCFAIRRGLCRCPACPSYMLTALSFVLSRTAAKARLRTSNLLAFRMLYRQFLLHLMTVIMRPYVTAETE